MTALAYSLTFWFYIHYLSKTHTAHEIIGLTIAWVITIIFISIHFVLTYIDNHRE